MGATMTTCHADKDSEELIHERGHLRGLTLETAVKACSSEPLEGGTPRPRKMIVTSQETILRNRIDEWSSLTDDNAASASCTCLPSKNLKKIARPGLRHFVADMPESDQIMVVDDGIPIWVDDKGDSSGPMKPSHAEGLGLKGMMVTKVPEEERQQMQEIQEDMRHAGRPRPRPEDSKPESTSAEAATPSGAARPKSSESKPKGSKGTPMDVTSADVSSSPDRTEQPQSAGHSESTNTQAAAVKPPVEIVDLLDLPLSDHPAASLSGQQETACLAAISAPAHESFANFGNSATTAGAATNLAPTAEISAALEGKTDADTPAISSPPQQSHNFADFSSQVAQGA